MPVNRLCVAAGLALALSGAVFAGVSPQVLIIEGDAVPGVGTVTTISAGAINNSGAWIVEIDTDGPSDFDHAVIRNGSVLLQEGDALTAPVGATISGFDSIDINNDGESLWNLSLDGVDDDSGIFRIDDLVIQEGDISAAAGFGDPTPYLGFFEVKLNDNNLAAVLASVDDPLIDSTLDRAIVTLSFAASGALLNESVLWKEGDVLPGQSQPIVDFQTSDEDIAINNSGAVAFIADLDGDTTTDGVIYVNSTLIAQEGSASPIAGRNWETLSGATVDLNNGGDIAFKGVLDGDADSDNVIVVNNTIVIAQEGQMIDALPAETVFTSFGSGPVLIADNDDVLWYGDWDDANTDIDTGLFLNQELIVQEGVTLIDGSLVDTIRGITNGYAISDNGRYVVFRAVLADGREGLFMIDFDGGATCAADLSDGGGKGTDGVVNVFDLLELLSNWGTAGPGADLADPTNIVNLFDLLELLSVWGACN